MDFFAFFRFLSLDLLFFVWEGDAAEGPIAQEEDPNRVHQPGGG